MISDWQTNYVFVADTLSDRHPALLQGLTRILAEFGVPLGTVSGTRDIWIRDAAPIQVSERDFVQFTYRPDYLRDGYQHLITGPKTFERHPVIKKLERSELVIDGGNVIGTAKTAILTRKVFRENPDRSRGEIEVELRRLLRVERLIFIPEEPDDMIGHADGMVRFLDESTLVMNDYSAVDPRFGQRLMKSLKDAAVDAVLLPYQPERRKHEEIDSAAGNYVNFLRVGKLIVVPVFGKPADRKAVDTLARHCPETRITTLPCLNLAREGGILQCVTWTVSVGEPPDPALL
jgi:agmatine deiminase